MPSLTPYHPVVSQLTTLLTEQDCWFETFEHEPVLTSAAAADIRDGYTLHQGAKAIILRVKISSSEKKFVMVVLPGDARFNGAKLKQLFSAKDIRFATSEEVEEITKGVLPGGIPPFGSLFNLETYVDPTLLENEKIIFNAGDRAYSIAMKSDEYLKVAKSTVYTLI